MANTLSGKLAKLDGVNEDAILANETSSSALLRFVGIVDQVVTVETNNIVLTGYSDVAEGERVLLSAQTDLDERGVYQLDSGDLKKVDHVIEDGNLVIDQSVNTPGSTTFWRFESLDQSWNQMTLADGIVDLS